MGWIIGFFKTIVVFVIIFMVLAMVGYGVLKLMMNDASKKLALVACLAVDIVLMGFASNKLAPIGLMIVFVAAVFAFLMRYRNLGKEYRRLEKISADLNIGWACLYACPLTAAFITIPQLRAAVPFEIKGFLWHLIVAYLMMLIVPVVQLETIQKRIENVYGQISKYKFISRYEINEIATMLAGEDPTADDLKNRKDEVIELVKYFEESGKIVPVDVEDSDTMLYLEADCYNNIKTIIDVEYKNSDIVDMNDILDRVKGTIKLNQALLSGLIYELFMSDRNYKLYDEYCISSAGVEKIIYALDHEYALGKKTEKEIAKQFHISIDALNELMDEEQYVVSNNLAATEKTVASNDKKLVEEESVEIQPIDINKCNEEDLLSLPSVSIVIAKKIIEYRKSKNGFRSIDEFMQVAQVKPHISEKIRSMVICSEPRLSNADNKPQEGPGRRIRLKGRIVEY